MYSKVNFVNSLIFQLETSVRIFYGYAKKSFAENMKNKITLDEFIILDTLVFYPHLNKSTLAKVLLQDECYVEKILERLKKKKFINDVKAPTCDIKVKHYELTRNGEKIYEDSIYSSTESLRILLKFISEDELLAFTKTLIKIKNITLSLQS